MNLRRSLWKCEEGKTWESWRTTTENGWSKKDNIKFCVCLSLLVMIYSLCMSRAVDAFHTLFLFFWQLLRRVVANKLLYQVNQLTVFCVYPFLSWCGYHEVQLNLKGLGLGSTSIDYLGPWCYIRLFDVVALHSAFLW